MRRYIFFLRHNVHLTASEIDLLFSKLPSEKNGSVSFEELVQLCFLNFSVTSQGSEGGQPGEFTTERKKKMDNAISDNINLDILKKNFQQIFLLDVNVI